MSLDSSTGAVTGIPSVVYAPANVVFSVQDANGVVANTTSTVIFVVGAASSTISATATTTPQSLTVGIAMASFSPLSPSGGAAPYTYSVRSGTLPAGLILDSVTGAVTGTPSAAYPTANVTFGVQDANYAAASTTSTVSFTVAPLGYVYAAGLTWMPISATTYTYANAVTLCLGTINGTNDWRLPTQPELSALYTAYPDNSGVGTGNSTLIAQGWTLGSTWSSTPDPNNSGFYFAVSLNSGYFGTSSQTSNINVACVR